MTKAYDQTACWVGASSKIKGTNCYKPGGTATLAMGACNGRIADKGTDPWGMGRWSYVLLEGKGTLSKLLTITGYQTGYRTGQIGHQAAWTQRIAVLFKDNREENPSDAFYKDLAEWIHKYRTADMELILCFDANERWSEKSTIYTFAEGLNRINVNQEFMLEATHPHMANLSKSTTIDYCLCIEQLSASVEYAASVPYDLESLGDHRGFVFIRIDRQGSLWDLLQSRKKLPASVGRPSGLVTEFD